MKDHISAPEVIHKDVVVIGNGPSGIALSFMLSGHLPYLISRDHPDEMLSARLHSATGHSLAQQPLGHLAAGLEGRSTNPVSLLLDALEHPCADLGIEMASLVQWRYHKDKEIDHVVFGKGPPGGSWHSMDPNILTLSLGSWMALPVIPYTCVDNTDSQRRATAGSVAQYYSNYVNQMDLAKYFHNSVCVTSIQPITDPNQPTDQLSHDTNHLAERETTNHVAENATVTLGNRIKYNSECSTVIKTNCELEIPRRKCSFVTALNYIRARTKCHKQKPKDGSGVRTCKRPRDSVSKHDMSPNRKVRELIDKSYISLDQSLYLTRISREIDNTLYINDEMLVCDAELLPPIRNQYRCEVNSDVDLLRPIRNDAVDVYHPPIRGPKYRYDVSNQYGGRNKYRSFSFSCGSDFEALANCDTAANNNQKHNSLINISDSKMCRCFEEKNVPTDDRCGMDTLCECSTAVADNARARWLVNTVDCSTGLQITYTCNNLILANGSSDLPNRLGLSAETYDLPWVLHDLRSLENKLDHFAQCMESSQITPDPVLVVGAGLSAADAVIATRFRSIPVLHVFRNRSVALDKQLPENMYPEYHKVHQMMLDGGSTYPLYTALPEHTVADISATDHTVTLLSKSGTPTMYKVSYVVILIGSRPNLTFLPAEVSLGVKKSTAIDAKSNPIDIDKMSHAVHGCDGLYAVGPLAGDNFVRFIPGGALAVVSDLYKNKNW